MSEEHLKTSIRVLEPYDRISEILFGLIMVLTFTGSLSAAEAGKAEIRTMLYAALGCNLAWGVIDAVMYLMSCLAERGSGLKTLRAVRATTDPENARRLIGGALPPLIASILEPAEFASIHQRLNQLPEPSGQVRLRAKDYLGALAVFLLVFLSTFPVVVPFLCISTSAWRALRLSNLIAIAMLFVIGCAFGRCTGRSPLIMGIAMVLAGLVLVALTIALGG